MSLFNSRTFVHTAPLMRLASPLILNALFQQACGMSTIFFVGNYLGPKYMGAVILGSMLCNISGYSIGFGMTAALDTLISQAFGAREYHQMGLFAQRAIAILSLCCIPIILLWRYSTTYILENALFIDSETATMSGIWAKYLSFGVWPMLMFEVLKKFQQGQNLIWPITVAAFLGLLTNVGLNYLFVVKMKAGFDGAAFSVVMSNWMMFSSMVVVVVVRKALIRCGLFSSWSLGGRRATPDGKTVRVGTARYSPLANRDLDEEEQAEEGGSDDLSSDRDTAQVMSAYERLESNALRGESHVLSSDHIELTNMILRQASQTQSALTRRESSSWSEKSGSTSVESDDGQQERKQPFVPRVTDDFIRSAVLDNRPPPTSESAAAAGSGNPEDNWPPLSPAVFREWRSFLALGVPGAVSLLIEWGSFELAAGMVGQLGPTALAVHSVYMQTCGMLYMPPLALASAASILVGNFLGEGHYLAAKEVVSLGILMDFAWGFGVGLLLYLFGREWVMLFTQDADVIALGESTMPIMFLYTVVDAMKCITLNLLRSTGQPRITVIFNFASCLLVLLPVGYLLGLKLGYGLWGVWGAMSLAWALCTVIYYVCLLRTDWEKQKVVKHVGVTGH